MDVVTTAKALLVVLHASRAPPLHILTRPKYPDRELCPKVNPDGSIVFTLAKFWFEYKHRGPRPKHPPAADTEGIQQALNTVLAPAGLRVQSVKDSGEYIKITTVQEDHPHGR